MAAPPNFHCYFGHSSSYFPGAWQPPGAAGEAARRGDTQRRAHGRGAGPTPARGGRRRAEGSGGRRGAGGTGRGAGATRPHLCTASPRPPPPSSRPCLRLRLTFPAAAAAAGEGRGGRRRGGVMRKHDREPSERRALPAPSRAEQRRTGAAQGRRAGAAPPAHAPAPAPSPQPPPPPRSPWRSRGRTLHVMLSGGARRGPRARHGAEGGSRGCGERRGAAGPSRVPCARRLLPCAPRTARPRAGARHGRVQSPTALYRQRGLC